MTDEQRAVQSAAAQLEALRKYFACMDAACEKAAAALRTLGLQISGQMAQQRVCPRVDGGLNDGNWNCKCGEPIRNSGRFRACGPTKLLCWVCARLYHSAHIKTDPGELTA